MRPLVKVVWVSLCVLTSSPRARAEPARSRAEALQWVEGAIQGADARVAASRIAFLGEEASAASMLAAYVDAPDVRQRRAVATLLESLGVRESEPSLIRLAQDEDGATRMEAVRGLGRIHSAAVGLLKKLLRDSTAGVRREAAVALGALGRPSLGPTLITAAQGEAELEVRAAMLLATGQSQDSRQIRPLEVFLRGSSESTRLAAVRGLCLLGAKSGFAYAAKLLQSTEPDQRRDGLLLLEGLRAKLAHPLLTPLLADRDPRLAARAARMLYAGGEVEMEDWLVLASFHARGADKLAYEDELDTLHLTDEERTRVLKKAGVR